MTASRASDSGCHASDCSNSAEASSRPGYSGSGLADTEWPEGVTLRLVNGLPQIVITQRALHAMGSIAPEVAAVLRDPVRYVHARYHEDAGVAPWPCCRLVLEPAIDRRALLLTVEPREGTPRWEVVL